MLFQTDTKVFFAFWKIVSRFSTLNPSQASNTEVLHTRYEKPQKTNEKYDKV